MLVRAGARVRVWERGRGEEVRVGGVEWLRVRSRGSVNAAHGIISGSNGGTNSSHTNTTFQVRCCCFQVLLLLSL